jgi:hypothetical protein
VDELSVQGDGNIVIVAAARGRPRRGCGREPRRLESGTAVVKDAGTLNGTTPISELVPIQTVRAFSRIAACSRACTFGEPVAVDAAAARDTADRASVQVLDDLERDERPGALVLRLVLHPDQLAFG